MTDEIALIDFARKCAKSENEHSKAGILAVAFINAYTALYEINLHNRINDDMQAYLFDLAKWGMGERNDEPKKNEYGI